MKIRSVLRYLFVSALVLVMCCSSTSAHAQSGLELALAKSNESSQWQKSDELYRLITEQDGLIQLNTHVMGGYASLRLGDIGSAKLRLALANGAPGANDWLVHIDPYYQEVHLSVEKRWPGQQLTIVEVDYTETFFMAEAIAHVEKQLSQMGECSPCWLPAGSYRLQRSPFSITEGTAQDHSVTAYRSEPPGYERWDLMLVPGFTTLLGGPLNGTVPGITKSLFLTARMDPRFLRKRKPRTKMFGDGLSVGYHGWLDLVGVPAAQRQYVSWGAGGFMGYSVTALTGRLGTLSITSDFGLMTGTTVYNTWCHPADGVLDCSGGEVANAQSAVFAGLYLAGTVNSNFIWRIGRSRWGLATQVHVQPQLVFPPALYNQGGVTLYYAEGAPQPAGETNWPNVVARARVGAGAGIVFMF